MVIAEGEFLEGLAVDDLPQRWPPPDGEIEVEVPHCGDDGSTGPSESTRLTRLRGTPPQLALASLDERGRIEALYLARGRFVALPVHPLHEGRYGSEAAPDLTRQLRCQGWPPMTGRVTHVSAWEGSLRVGRTVWRVDAQTRVRAPDVVAGVPGLEERQRVRVSGLRCGQRRLVARNVVVRG